MDLSDFYLEDETREFLRQPFNFEDYTIATDGHRLLRTTLQPQHEECPDVMYEKVSVLLAVLDSLESHAMKPFPKIEWPDKVDCRNCLGAGGVDINLCYECKGEKRLTFTSPHNTYGVTCKSCEGRGALDGLPLMQSCELCNGSGKSKYYQGVVWVEGIKVLANYLVPLAESDSVMIMPSSDGMKLYFKGPTGDSGVIYGMSN